jgi:hypothetical protein
MSRSTLIGLVALALVAAGVWWPRPPSPAVGHLPPASARQTPSPEGDDALPDVTLADGSADAGEGVRITLSLNPQPPVAFATTKVRVRVEAGGSPVRLEAGMVSFEMTMPMGDHRYSLLAGQDGWQEAEVVLPRCLSGKRRWYATVEGTVAGEPRTARFRLDLKPPGQAPSP